MPKQTLSEKLETLNEIKINFSESVVLTQDMISTINKYTVDFNNSIAELETAQIDRQYQNPAFSDVINDAIKRREINVKNYERMSLVFEKIHNTIQTVIDKEIKAERQNIAKLKSKTKPQLTLVKGE